MSSIEAKSNQLEAHAPYPILPVQREEIDLLNIMAMLYSAKKQIIGITLIFALCGVIASFLLPQKWTSKAVITAPESAQINELNRAVINMTVLGVEAKIDRDSVFNMFLKKFDSQSLREAFLSKSPYVQALLANNEVDTSELHRAIVNVSEKFRSQSDADPKQTVAGPYTSWTLSFIAPEAENAQQVLQAYIEFITAEVNNSVLQDLKDAVNLQVAFEKDKLRLDRTLLENEHNINLRRLGYSLQVANAAGIKKPVYSNGQAVKDDPDYSVALGADGLAEKLKIEQSIKDVAALNASLQNREHRISQLEGLNIGEVDFSPFKYQMQPSLPVKKDGPGKALVVILSTLVGFILAAGIALTRQAFSSRSAGINSVV